MRKRWIGVAVAALAATIAFLRLGPGETGAFAATTALDREALAAALAQPLARPEQPMRVYHLGHSLVGREMPAMLGALADARFGPGHISHSQLGWGASLAQHWQGKVPGFDSENRHRNFRPAAEAIGSGDYDAVVLTEMVELRDAIRWHDSASYLARWAQKAREARPDVRLYLFETWHRLDDPAGWSQRIASDRAALWEAGLLAPAMAQPGVGTIHIIPAGQVMAAALGEIEAGRVPGLSSRADLFADEIHPGPIGNWLVALTHYAVLYQRPPAGMTGSAAPTAAVPVLQDLVWRVVMADPATGIARPEP